MVAGFDVADRLGETVGTGSLWAVVCCVLCLLLLLINPPPSPFPPQDETPFTPGDIIVFKLDGRDVPIVHRVITAHDAVAAVRPQQLLTKGDANRVDDRGYASLPSRLFYPVHYWCRH